MHFKRLKMSLTVEYKQIFLYIGKSSRILKKFSQVKLAFKITCCELLNPEEFVSELFPVYNPDDVVKLLPETNEKKYG